MNFHARCYTMCLNVINCNWKLNSKLLLDANPQFEILNHYHSDLNFHLELKIA